MTSNFAFLEHDQIPEYQRESDSELASTLGDDDGGTVAGWTNLPRNSKADSSASSMRDITNDHVFGAYHRITASDSHRSTGSSHKQLVNHNKQMDKLSKEVFAQKLMHKDLKEDVQRAANNVHLLKNNQDRLKKQVEALQGNFNDGNSAPQNSVSTDSFAHLSAKVDSLIQSQKADHRKIEKLEKVQEDDQQTIAFLKNQLTELASVQVTRREDQQDHLLSTAIREFQGRIDAEVLRICEEKTGTVQVQLMKMVEETNNARQTQFNAFKEENEEKLRELQQKLQNAEEPLKYASELQRLEKNAIEFQRLERYVPFLAALPPSNQYLYLYLNIKHSPSVETRLDGNYFLCSRAWFLRNIDNIVHFLFDGEADAKYPNGVYMEAIVNGYSLPETFVDDIIKTLPTTPSPEKFPKYFNFYANCNSKLPSWWSQHAHLANGNYLDSIVANQHNESVKFKITFQSNVSKSKMLSFRIDRL